MLKSIQSFCYPELRKYPIGSAYKNNAMSRACGILSNYRRVTKKGKRAKIPYASKPILTACEGFGLRIDCNELILPQKVRILLNDYVLKKLDGRELRSVTITTSSFSIAYYSKEASEIDSTGVMGIDFNFENITTADSTQDILRNIHRYPMDQVSEFKQQCRETKRHFKRNDSKIRKLILQK